MKYYYDKDNSEGRGDAITIDWYGDQLPQGNVLIWKCVLILFNRQ